MIKTLALAGLVICIPIAAGAQDALSAKVKIVDPAAEMYANLVKDHKAETTRINDHNMALTKTPAYMEARKNKDRAAMTELRKAFKSVDLDPYLAQASAGAEKFAGTDGAVDFLAWTMTSAKGDQASAAMATVLEHHVKSAKLESMVSKGRALVRPLGMEATMGFLQTVDKESPHKSVRAHAIYQMHKLLARDKNASQDVKDAAAARLSEAAELAGDSPLRDRINAPKFQEERLQIGMVVPEIVGTDLFGKPMRLSDFRGKVTVLDFWGNW